MSLRIGGIAAIVGASLIVIVIALTGGLTEGSDKAGAIALLVALVALLVALDRDERVPGSFQPVACLDRLRADGGRDGRHLHRGRQRSGRRRPYGLA